MKKTIIISAITACLVSCSDFIEVTSEQNLTYETFYKSEADCRSATAVLYNAPWFEFNGAFMWEVGEARANNMFIDRGGLDSPSGVLNRFMETAATNDLINGWNSLYNVVTQSDHILNNLYRAEENGVNRQAVDKCRGEARFMRGLAYWYLLSIWGNVPIVEDPVALTENYVVPSNNREDVLLYAIRDMEYAAENLPKIAEQGRLTRYSALGMLSRLYITAACYQRGGLFSESRASFTAEEYYEKARLAALDVCENGTQYQLMDDYEQLFRPQNNNNSESLFALQWVPGSTTYGVGNRCQINLAYSADMLGGYKAYGGSCYLSGEYIQLMAERGETSRLRGTAFVKGEKYDYLGTSTDKGYWEVSGSSMCRVKKQVVGGYKDTYGAAQPENSGLATPMLRLAEVYLLLAEATLATNSSLADVDADKRETALYYFNKVNARSRNAHAMTDFTNLTLEDIWNERRAELGMECQYWYDIVRRAYWDKDWVIDYLNAQNRGHTYSYNGTTFKWVDYKHKANQADANRLLLPYPETELTVNPKLKENVPYNL